MKMKRSKVKPIRSLTIRLEDNSNDGDGHNDETIVAHVLGLIRQGYTSGYEPTWSIDEIPA